MKIKSFQAPAKPCSESGWVSKTTFTSFKHANSWALAETLLRKRMSQQDHVHIIQTCKLLGPCQTLLRERRVSKTTTTSFKTCKSRALGLLPKPCKGSEWVSKTTFTSNEHVNKEHSSSWQNLAKEADESARPRQHHSDCNQELSSSYQSLAPDAKSRHDHVYIIQTCKQELLSSCQNSARVANGSLLQGLLPLINAEEHIEAQMFIASATANFEMFQHFTVGAQNAILMTNIPLPPHTLQIFTRHPYPVLSADS